jgi:hypothetical protein
MSSSKRKGNSTANVQDHSEPHSTPAENIQDSPGSTETTSPKKRGAGTSAVNGNDLTGTPQVPSPKKREGDYPVPGSQKKGKQSKYPTVTVYAFRPELGIEGYTYTKDDQNDAFCNNYKKYTEGEIEHKALAEARFTGFMTRRRTPTDNDALENSGDGYWRHVMLRYVPGSVSTPETRKEGLKVLSAFYGSKIGASYPPKEIVTCNGSTCDTHYFSLDSFFQDDDIKEIIETVFDPDELVPKFFKRYPDIAAKLWSGEPYPVWARDTLGFGGNA